jgi:hypothetical protein
VPVTKEQFGKMLKAPAEVPFDGLGNKGKAVFKVPQKWSQGKFRPPYLAIAVTQGQARRF